MNYKTRMVEKRLKFSTGSFFSEKKLVRLTNILLFDCCFRIVNDWLYGNELGLQLDQLVIMTKAMKIHYCWKKREYRTFEKIEILLYFGLLCCKWAKNMLQKHKFCYASPMPIRKVIKIKQENKAKALQRWARHLINTT